MKYTHQHVGGVYGLLTIGTTFHKEQKSSFIMLWGSLWCLFLVGVANGVDNWLLTMLFFPLIS